MDDEQRNASTKFMKEVQTTTITVGSAPPSNGDAMTWAASVQSNPVPTKYALMGIENLFTDHFTRHLSPNVKYDGLKKKLAGAAYNYCQVLKTQGKVSSCKSSYNIEGTGVGISHRGYKYIRDIDKVTCEEICLDDAECVAVEFRNVTSTVCLFFKGDVYNSLEDRKESQIIILLSQLATNKKILSLEKASFQGYSFLAKKINRYACRKECQDLIECDAYSWNLSRSLWCSLFTARDITDVLYSPLSHVRFVQKN